MPDALAIVLGCAGTVFCAWLLYNGFRRGTMQFDYNALHLHGHRKDQPVRFWATAVMIFLTMLMFGIVTVVLLFG